VDGCPPWARALREDERYERIITVPRDAKDFGEVRLVIMLEAGKQV